MEQRPIFPTLTRDWGPGAETDIGRDQPRVLAQKDGGTSATPDVIDARDSDSERPRCVSSPRAADWSAVAVGPLRGRAFEALRRDSSD
jgi:hypothetical protein